MSVAIIGTGAFGTSLARALVRGGAQVSIGSRDAARAAEHAARVGAVRGGTHAEIVALASVIVLAIDYEHAFDVLPQLHGLRGKIIVDPTTPWDQHVGPVSGAERLAKRVPESAFVGAWKTTFARELDAAKPGEPHDALLCGDDESAKSVVAELVRSTGFRALDAGPLEAARVLEGMCRIMGPVAKSAGVALPAWTFAR